MLDAQGMDAQGMGGAPGPGGGGLNPDGTMRGVAPGQQGMGPGGRPDLNIMLASLGRDGEANLSAGVSRRIPV